MVHRVMAQGQNVALVIGKAVVSAFLIPEPLKLCFCK